MYSLKNSVGIESGIPIGKVLTHFHLNFHRGQLHLHIRASPKAARRVIHLQCQQHRGRLRPYHQHDYRDGQASGGEGGVRIRRDDAGLKGQPRKEPVDVQRVPTRRVTRTIYFSNSETAFSHMFMHA